MPSDISQQRRQAAGNRVEALASPEYVQTSKRFVMNAIGFDSFCMCLTPCLTESGSLKRRRHAAASAAAGHAARHADAPADAAGHAANAARNAALHGSGTRCIAASRPIVQVMGWQSISGHPHAQAGALPCYVLTPVPDYDNVLAWRGRCEHSEIPGRQHDGSSPATASSGTALSKPSKFS